MALDVHIVVFSNAPKDLGPGVEVIVGLPSKNPWSLPFAHKAVFAERLENYDLFAYSEDDIEVTENNIRAFLQATPDLGSDEIAGFLRHEVGESGTLTLPEVHGAFHWKPQSVGQRRSYTVAEFTNAHAGFYLLTREQLRRAIASGGFLKSPRNGCYGMLETAATDPYTCCGFRKVICISALDDFLVHHMPNRYVGEFGIPIALVREQIKTLVSIGERKWPALTLCRTESRMPGLRWSKDFYEGPDKELLGLVPVEAQKVLSIGCGSGEMEACLVERGVQVTSLPLNSVAGALASRSGINMVYATLEEGLEELQGGQFDCALLTDLLHLADQPADILRRCAGLLRNGGNLVLGGPNFDYLPILLKRLRRSGEFGKLRDFSASGIRTFGVAQLQGWLRSSGFHPAEIVWQMPAPENSVSGAIRQSGWGRLTSGTWLRLRRAAFRHDETLRRWGWRSWNGAARWACSSWLARAQRTS